MTNEEYQTLLSLRGFAKTEKQVKAVNDLSKVFYGAPVSVVVFCYLWDKDVAKDKTASEVYSAYELACKDFGYSAESPVILSKYIQKEFNLKSVKVWNKKEKKTETIYREG